MPGFLRVLLFDKEAPSEELMQAYRKLTKLHDGIRYEVSMAEFNNAFTEIENLLLKAYHGEEDDADGGDENLGDS